MGVDQTQGVRLLQFLRLLQLVSPSLPVGAYSYSEGLETLAHQGRLSNANQLLHWLNQELAYGAIRVEAVVMLRAYHCAQKGDLEGFLKWNHWLSAVRETEELRQQSWQMGRSLLKLLQSLPSCESTDFSWFSTDQPRQNVHHLANQWSEALDRECNFAIAYALAVQDWQLEEPIALSGYLQTWLSNLVSAGVRLIPLGQTQGQQVLWQLHSQVVQVSQTILDQLDPSNQSDEDLWSCSWGLALASMNHECLYSRLFRS